MKAKQNISGIVLATVLLTLAYGFLIEPYQFEVGHVWFENTQLNKILKGKTAIHLSDLHIGKIGRREQKVLRFIERLWNGKGWKMNLLY